MSDELYYNTGKTCLRYTSQKNLACIKVVDFPAQLLTETFDPEPARFPECEFEFTTEAEALMACFTKMPQNPSVTWQPPANSLPNFKSAFFIFKQMLCEPPKNRWAVRGTPEHFLIAGYGNEKKSHIAAIVLATGKPAVLTFRLEDFMRKIHPDKFQIPSITYQADGLPEETISDVAFDARLRLPILDNGGVHITLNWS